MNRFGESYGPEAFTTRFFSLLRKLLIVSAIPSVILPQKPFAALLAAIGLCHVLIRD